MMPGQDYMPYAMGVTESFERLGCEGLHTNSDAAVCAWNVVPIELVAVALSWTEASSAADIKKENETVRTM
jgi:hypothetical protein